MLFRLALFLLPLLIAAQAPAQEPRAITVLTGEWPPYVEEADPHRGILSALLKLALDDMNYQPTFEFTLFDIAKKRALSDKTAITFPWFEPESDDADWYVTNEFLDEIEYVFFYNKLNKAPASDGKILANVAKDIETLDDLAGYRIGGVVGYSYRPQVAKLIDDAGQRSVDELIAFRRLIDGEIDFLPASRKVGEHLLDLYFATSRHKIGQLATLSTTQPRPVRVLASRAHAENKVLIEKLDAALKRLNKSGVMASIEMRYAVRRKFDQVVRLEGGQKFPIVTGFEKETDVSGYLIPNGTRAIVVDWGERFVQPGQVDIPQQMFTKSKVRLLNGPLKGRELYINSLYINFE